MSREGFDELLVKKLQQEEFEYNPAHWERLAQLLPPAGAPSAAEEAPEAGNFDTLLVQKIDTEEFAYTPAHWEQLSMRLPAPAEPSAAEANAFDELLVKRIAEEELPYQPAHWQQLARLLPPALRAAAGNGRKWAIAAGIAAALVLASVFLLRRTGQHTEENNIPALVQHPASSAPGKGGERPAAAGAPQAPQHQLAKQGAASRQPQPALPASPLPGMPPAPEQAPPVLPPIAAPDQRPQEVAAVRDPASATRAGEHKDPAAAHPAKAAQEQYARNSSPAPALSPSFFYEGSNSGKANARTSVALGGGVNYGNLNTGYTAGVSVRHKVGSDFFVDGTVAMLYNNNASNVAANHGPPLQESSNLAARPAAFSQTNLASPALDPIQKLYYVQFNPSIGYQPEKHVALSIGGDFQQLLNKSSEIVQPESSNSRVLPNFDIGLTAKSEFAIAPNIQAGIIYREGLNNLLKSEGGKYVNRRYVQVQFKYSLPVN